jgi:hypothetical protein
MYQAALLDQIVLGSFFLGSIAMTFVSVPKPTWDHATCMHRKVAVGSWLASDPDSRVILFIFREDFCQSQGVPDDLDDIFGVGRVIYAGELKSNGVGIPYVDMWFQMGVNLSQTKYVSIINTDIIISGSWLPAVIGLLESVGPSFRPLIFSPRIDVDVPDNFIDSLRFTKEDLSADIDTVMPSLGLLRHKKGGVDVFTFFTFDPPFDLRELLPFLIGRYAWDGWMIGLANGLCNTISMSWKPMIYHVNHIRYEKDGSDQMVEYNWNLGHTHGGYKFHVQSAKWLMKGGELVRNKGPMMTLAPFPEVD